MVIVIGRVQVDESDLVRCSELMADVVASSRAEAKCVRYTCSRDLSDAATFHFAEEWEDREALLAHTRTDHFRAWSRALAELTVHERDVHVFEATETSLS